MNTCHRLCGHCRVTGLKHTISFTTVHFFSGTKKTIIFVENQENIRHQHQQTMKAASSIFSAAQTIFRHVDRSNARRLGANINVNNNSRVL